MLAVTTFSLSVMTSAYSAATSNVTPRAIKLLIEDRLTQNVLSSFIGSFLFSIVGIVVLKTGAYGDSGRFALFIVTIAVIALVVVSLLRWIDHLTRLGRVGETTERVEEAIQRAIDVLGRQARVLCTWARDQQADQTPQFPRVWVEALHTRDLFEDVFNPIARDGASLLEVQMKLRKTLQALSQRGDTAFRQAAFEQAERALARAEQAMSQEADKQRLRELR